MAKRSGGFVRPEPSWFDRRLRETRQRKLLALRSRLKANAE